LPIDLQILRKIKFGKKY